MAEPVRHERAGRPGYEARDISLRPVVGVGVAILVSLVLFAALVWWLYGALAGLQQARTTPAHPLAATEARELPPAPRLQAHPLDDLVALRAWEQERLASYSWVDRDAGVVRVPIERAMELVVERGLPARAGGEGR